MEGLNKVLALFLVLFIAIVLTVFLLWRLGLIDKFLPDNKFRFTQNPPPTKGTPTPTLSPTAGPSPTPTRGPSPTPKPGTLTLIPTPTGMYPGGGSGTQSPTWAPGTTPGQIPSTGLPTLVVPVLGAALGAGIYLKRKS